MRYLLRILAAAALGGAGSAHALSLDVSYASDRERDTGFAATGFSAGISQVFGQNFFIGAGYARLRTEPFADGELEGRLEYASAGLSLGAGFPIMGSVGLGASAGYAGAETRGLDDFEDDPVQRVHGPTGSLTLSAQPTSWFAWFVGPSYSYIGRVPGWQGAAGLSLRVLDTVWLNGSYWSAEAVEGWSAGLRKDFGAD